MTNPVPDVVALKYLKTVRMIWFRYFVIVGKFLTNSFME